MHQSLQAGHRAAAAHATSSNAGQAAPSVLIGRSVVLPRHAAWHCAQPASQCSTAFSSGLLPIARASGMPCRAVSSVAEQSVAPVSAPRVPSSGPAPYYFRDTAPWPTAADIRLPAHDLDTTPRVDLVVAGGGPAGVAVAQRVAAAGFSVCVVDPEPLGVWPNNYGVWVDEFQAMGMEDCLEVVWPKAKVWLDSGSLGAK